MVTALPPPLLLRAQAGAAPRPRGGVLPHEVAAGLSLLYKELIQPNKALRARFLQVHCPPAHPGLRWPWPGRS